MITYYNKISSFTSLSSAAACLELPASRAAPAAATLTTPEATHMPTVQLPRQLLSVAITLLSVAITLSLTRTDSQKSAL